MSRFLRPTMIPIKNDNGSDPNEDIFTLSDDVDDSSPEEGLLLRQFEMFIVHFILFLH